MQCVSMYLGGKGGIREFREVIDKILSVKNARAWVSMVSYLKIIIIVLKRN